jgi:hypothetical protein
MMAVQMATRPIPRCFRVKAYPVNVEPGTAVVKGPYIAETIKVAVETTSSSVSDPPHSGRREKRPFLRTFHPVFSWYRLTNDRAAKTAFFRRKA